MIVSKIHSIVTIGTFSGTMWVLGNIQSFVALKGFTFHGLSVWCNLGLQNLFALQVLPTLGFRLENCHQTGIFSSSLVNGFGARLGNHITLLATVENDLYNFKSVPHLQMVGMEGSWENILSGPHICRGGDLTQYPHSCCCTRQIEQFSDKHKRQLWSLNP